MIVAWVKVMATNMKRWIDFGYILEEELIGLSNEFSIRVMVEKEENHE